MTLEEKKVHVLAVEDDDVDFMSLEREFCKAQVGHPLIRARDGREALEMLQEGRVPSPCLVLLDLNMPRMSGLEFLDAIRSDGQLKRLAVFVMTTSQNHQDVEQAYQKGVAGYIVKKDSGDGFSESIEMIKVYCDVVCLPV